MEEEKARSKKKKKTIIFKVLQLLTYKLYPDVH